MSYLHESLDIPTEHPIELLLRIDVISVLTTKQLHQNFKLFLDANSVDCTHFVSGKEWKWIKYDTVMDNTFHRITLLWNDYVERYLIRFYDLTLNEIISIRHLFGCTDQYKVNMIEYDFDFSCFNPYDATILLDFINSHYHLSYLRKPSLSIPDVRTRYRSNPRKSKGRSNRIYNERSDGNIARLEYIMKRRWIKNNGVKEMADCFFVHPHAVTKGSSFRSFDQDKISRMLRSSMHRNIASRVVNTSKSLMDKEG